MIMLTFNLSSRFKAKYHPSDLKKQKEAAEHSLKARLDAFRYLSDNGWFEEGAALELPNQDSVLKIMNAGGQIVCVCVWVGVGVGVCVCVSVGVCECGCGCGCGCV